MTNLRFFLVALIGLFLFTNSLTAQNFAVTLQGQTCTICDTTKPDPSPQKPLQMTPEQEFWDLTNSTISVFDTEIPDEKWIKKSVVFDGVKMQLTRKNKPTENIKEWQFWTSKRGDEKNLPTKIFFLITDSGKFVFSFRNLSGYKKTTMLVSNVRWDVFVIDPTMLNFELKL